MILAPGETQAIELAKTAIMSVLHVSIPLALDAIRALPVIFSNLPQTSTNAF